MTTADLLNGASARQVQSEVERFWNAKPCGSDLSDKPTHSREYFLEVQAERYKYEGHILELLDQVPWKGKRVLEIGAGVGTDGRMLIERGARYTGINVDAGSTAMANRALQAFELPGQVIQCSATDMVFEDRSFDAVYSFGVLLCIPEVGKAIDEIRRVLKPGGEVLVMLYNRTSINYAVEIRWLRRLFRHALVVPGAIPALAALGLPRAKLERHAELVRSHRDMSEAEWLSRNTDGPDNPYATVYDRDEAAALFRGFEIVTNEVHFFDYRHWGAIGRRLPDSWVRALGRRWGWHRIVRARLA